MKRLLILTNMLWITVVLYQSCRQEQVQPAAASGANDNSEKVLSAREEAALTSASCPGCTDYKLFKFAGISADVAKSLSKNYQTIDQPLLQIEPGIPDASSIWFSLETLKGFVWKIEEAVCKNNCTSKMKLGLRLYYGRYPEAAEMAATPDLSGLPASFAEHHTLFLVPTYQDAVDPLIQWDFDPWHMGTSNCKPKTMAAWFQGSDRPFGQEKSLVLSVNETQYFKSGGGGWSAAMNHGDLIPPYSATGTGYNYP